MRKIITCMILGLLSLVSCTEYDEVAMWNKNEDMGSRLAALEELCSRLNTNIVSLQQIVEALQGNDYVTGVVPVVENGETVGYTISFSKSGPVTIIRKTKRCDFPERSVRFCKTKCILGSTPTLLLISQNRPAYAGNVKRRLNTIQTPFALRFVASLPPMLSR